MKKSRVAGVIVNDMVDVKVLCHTLYFYPLCTSSHFVPLPTLYLYPPCTSTHADAKVLCQNMRMPALDSALALPDALLAPGALVATESGPQALRTALTRAGATLAIPQDQALYSVHGRVSCGAGTPQVPLPETV